MKSKQSTIHETPMDTDNQNESTNIMIATSTDVIPVATISENNVGK